MGLINTWSSKVRNHYFFPMGLEVRVSLVHAGFEVLKVLVGLGEEPIALG